MLFSEFPIIVINILTVFQILQKALASVEYIYKANGDVANVIRESYIDGLWYSHIVSLGASLLAFLLTPLLREYKL